MPCDTVEESQPRNSESCDRDCTRARWPRWKPCSAACGGGMRERVKHVPIPIHGKGKDLIIAVDGSGSLQKDGFIILRNRFGQDKVGLGLVPFGNDVTMPDGKTISPAINPQSLTGDKSAMVAVHALLIKKGSTYMALFFAMAFGTCTLLREAKLYLKEDKFHGLLGLTQ